VTKRRTEIVDDDVADGAELLDDENVSLTVSDALREVLATSRHRAAVVDWLDDLDNEFGSPSEAAVTRARQMLDELGVGLAQDAE